MQTISTQQCVILDLLSDGFNHSGNMLAQQSGISRTAVWKHIHQLIALGFPIQIMAKKGYQLTYPLQLLTIEGIQSSLHNKNLFNFHLFTSIDSTNKYLKTLPITSTIPVCCAETQTAGRGRFGRSWHSPLAENIYCSIRWPFEGDISQLSGLSLVISLVLIHTLQDLQIEEGLSIKWPNDILWQGKKLCGILIETLGECNGQTQAIIGIGMNINSDTHQNPLPDKPWCSLFSITGKYFDRNTVLACLLNQLEKQLDRFVKEGLAAFMDEWTRYDGLAGKNITITQNNQSFHGIARGIQVNGELIVEDMDNNTVHFFSTGEASFKQN